MDLVLWAILSFPLIWPFVAKLIWNKDIDFFEIGLNIVLVVGLVTAVWQLGKYSQTADVEVWNGQVTGKEAIKKSCPWGWTDYSDGFCQHYRTRQVKDGEICSTDSKGKQSCTPTYKTQYNYDYSWERRFFVSTNLQRRYEIRKVDKQGVRYPKRFNQTQKGDPASRTSSYTNYVRAASSSLFSKEGSSLAEKYAKKIPKYPLKIYDYYNIDRVLDVAKILNEDELRQWNRQLSHELKTLGPKKQVNIIMLITDVASPNYMNAVQASWQGAKKNDIVIAIGVDKDRTIKWADAFSWSKADMVNIVLRDELIAAKKLDKDKIFSIIRETVSEHYVRRPMEEFEYLAEEIEPPLGVQITAGIIAVLGSIVLSILFLHVDLGATIRRRM